MPEAERILMANKLGLVTADGHALSPSNQYLVLLQCPGATVLGGFKQWQKHGRSVRKGEHGAMIWVPCGGRKNNAPLDGSNSNSAIADGEPTGDTDGRFIVGCLFDISQTTETTQEAKFSPEMPAAIPDTQPSPDPMPAQVAAPTPGELF